MSTASKPDIHSLLELLQSFSKAVLRDAAPQADDGLYERAYASAIQAMCTHPCFTFFLNESPAPNVKEAAPQKRRMQLVLTHQCKYIGCHKATCDLCRNNQEKRCAAGDNMDEYYIVRKSIKSKCGADVLVELVDADTRERVRDANLQLQVSVTDGDRIEHPGQLDDLADIEIFANKDGNNQPLLLTANPVRRDSFGRLLISLQDGIAHLPDISVSCVTEKLEVRSFRLLVCITSRPAGAAQEVAAPTIEPALSCRFKVITQRAWNDRKAAYPHVDDRVNRLDFIGKEAVTKLQKLDQELSKAGFSLPSLSSIQTVGDLKQLKEHMQQDHNLQSTVIRMLNLNYERWSNICHVLDERTVVSDNLPRAFFPPQQDGRSRREGLFYKSRQARVDLKNPDGLIEKMPTEDGRDTYIVTLFSSGSTALLHKKVEACRSLAISRWGEEGHPGWRIAPEHVIQGCVSPSKASSWGGTSANSGPFLGSGAGTDPTVSTPKASHPHACLDSPSCRSGRSQQYLTSPTAGLPRDISNIPHHYVRPKRAHSEYLASPPHASMLGSRTHSAPEALVPRPDHLNMTSPGTPNPKSTQTREASYSADASPHPLTATTLPTTFRYADAHSEPGLPKTPRRMVTRALFGQGTGTRTSDPILKPSPHSSSNHKTEPNMDLSSAVHVDPSQLLNSAPDVLTTNFTAADTPRRSLGRTCNSDKHPIMDPQPHPESSHSSSPDSQHRRAPNRRPSQGNDVVNPYMHPNLNADLNAHLNPALNSDMTPGLNGTGLAMVSRSAAAGVGTEAIAPPPSFPSNMYCLEIPELSLEPLLNTHLPASQDLPTDLYPHTQSSPTGVSPTRHAAVPGMFDPPNASLSRSSQATPFYDGTPRPSMYSPTPYSKDPLTTSSTCFTSLLHSASEDSQLSLAAAGSENLNSPSNQQLPTAFGVPQLEGVLASIASYVPQRAASKELPTPFPTTQQHNPDWERQPLQRAGNTPTHTNPHVYPMLVPPQGQLPGQQMPDAIGTLDAGYAGNVASSAPMMMSTSLNETPSFDLIPTISDATLDSMPSIGMMVSACMTTPATTQPLLSPTSSSGMAWESIILEAAQNMSRMPNSAGPISNVSNLYQGPQQQAVQWA